MNDATGMPASAVVLGGDSELAAAVLAKLAKRRLERVVLAGRNEQGLARRCSELSALGVGQVNAVHFDATDHQRHDALASEIASELGDIDLVVMATGALERRGIDELTSAEVAQSIDTNFTGPAAALLGFTRVLRSQGHGTLVVFSSLAAVRVRRANFVYGSAKAGLDGFCQGLQDELEHAKSGVRLMIVRPGFVHTKMTTGMRPQPLATEADVVADAVVRGLETGAGAVVVPAALGPLSVLMRLVPRPLWRRLPS